MLKFLSPNSNLKMTVERSKRRSFLSLMFITKHRKLVKGILTRPTTVPQFTLLPTQFSRPVLKNIDDVLFLFYLCCAIFCCNFSEVN